MNIKEIKRIGRGKESEELIAAKVEIKEQKKKIIRKIKNLKKEEKEF